MAQAILSGGMGEGLLQVVVRRERALSDSTSAAIALVEGGGPLTGGVAEGDDPDLVVGVALGAGAASALRSRQAVAMYGSVAEQAAFATSAGPRLVLPLVTAGEELGVLVLARGAGGERFEEGDVQSLQLYALTATAALEYTRARRLVDELALVEDRERIARDLHDGAIQALFAVGMHLQQTALLVDEMGMRSRLEDDELAIDAVIRDLRGYIFALRPGVLRDLGLGEALQRLPLSSTPRAG